jgi:hypothetical protein
MDEPAFNPIAATRWLTALYGTSPAGQLSICAARSGKFSGNAFDSIGESVAAARIAEARLASGIYHRVTTIRPEVAHWRGTAADAYVLPGLWADIDGAWGSHDASNLPATREEAARIVRTSGLPEPSAWVDSGGGLYAWWLLDAPHVVLDIEGAGRLTATWHRILAASAARLGYHLDNTSDLARVMRLPGSINRKMASNPRPCYAYRIGQRHTFAALRTAAARGLAALPAEPVREARPAGGLAGEAVRQRDAGDSLTPGDDYDARTDWADILIPRGWTLVRELASGERQWRRPGTTSPMTASTGRNGDDKLYSFSPNAGVPEHLPIRKWHFIAYVDHNGNFANAARELRRAGYGGASTLLGGKWPTGSTTTRPMA